LLKINNFFSIYLKNFKADESVHKKMGFLDSIPQMDLLELEVEDDSGNEGGGGGTTLHAFYRAIRQRRCSAGAIFEVYNVYCMQILFGKCKIIKIKIE
jgi:hypothetical protein